ncbi:MAG TPA: MerR family transcriptional regulator, partial [Ilumatobacteraceae bacterium]|nr:MerR family transcriptional regulator [Ilumatobacteraceae bacterium]
MSVEGSLQIGEVADAVGLSIRTIRHYDELGLVEPSGRSPGGFRLYTGADVERLGLVKRLKPLQFSLEEIQELLATLDKVNAGTASGDEIDRLDMFAASAEERCDDLRRQLHMAEELAAHLRRAAPTASRRSR